jgi:putative oxidoreductase
MKYLIVIGRFLYSLIFLMTIRSHFASATIAYADSKAVPFASILVPLSGIIAIAGGLSILLGYKAKTGGLLIIIFLIPVTYCMHDFWNQTDPMQMQIQMGNFMKNMSLLGGAIFITYFGSGAYSLDKFTDKFSHKKTGKHIMVN